VEREAARGNPDELARIVTVAQGRGRITDAWAVARAQRVLAEIEKTNPQILQTFLAQKGTAV
jgi:putative chitinase